MSQTAVLFLNVLVVATCGLVYELLAGTAGELPARRLGHPVLDRHRRLPVRHGRRRVAVPVRREGAGRASSSRSSWPSPCSAGSRRRSFLRLRATPGLPGRPATAVVFLIGTLVGLEIPLLMRILKDQLEFKDLVSRVLAFDYLGALVAVAGCSRSCWCRAWALMRTSLVFGIAERRWSACGRRGCCGRCSRRRAACACARRSVVIVAAGRRARLRRTG